MLLKSTLLCLALTIYQEARGESVFGKQAVAQVVMNRSRENKTSPCHEVFKPGQFSWTRTNFKVPASSNKEWINAKKIALQVMNNNIPVRSTFFQQKLIRTNHTRFLTLEVVIGNHAFFRK